MSCDSLGTFRGFLSPGHTVWSHVGRAQYLSGTAGTEQFYLVLHRIGMPSIEWWSSIDGSDMVQRCTLPGAPARGIALPQKLLCSLGEPKNPKMVLSSAGCYEAKTYGRGASHSRNSRSRELSSPPFHTSSHMLPRISLKYLKSKVLSGLGGVGGLRDENGMRAKVAVCSRTIAPQRMTPPPPPPNTPPPRNTPPEY